MRLFFHFIASAALVQAAAAAGPDLAVQPSGGNASVTWNPVLSGKAHLEHSVNLSAWTTVSANNTAGSFRHAVGNARAGFYRLRIVGMLAQSTTLGGSSDTGSSSIDGVTYDRTPTLAGRVLGAASHVRISINGQPGALVPVVNGTWTHTVPAESPLPEGIHTVSATPVGASDATGEASPPVFVWLKSTPPAAPTAVLDDSSDTGTKGDGLTTEQEPAISGTAPRGLRVKVAIDGVFAGMAQSDANTGAWSFKAPRLANGAHEILAVCVDQAGLESAPAAVHVEVSGPRTVVLDASVWQTIELKASHILGGRPQGFIVTKVHGGTLEKWGPANTAWTAIPPEPMGTAPATLENAPAIRTILFTDTVRWTPAAGARGMGPAFDVVPLDRAGGAAAPVPLAGTVPGRVSAPRVLAEPGVGTEIAWGKPTTGCNCTSTRYSIQVTREDGRTLLYNLPQTVGKIAVVEGGAVEKATIWAATKTGAGEARSYDAAAQRMFKNRIRYTAVAAFSAMPLGRGARAQLEFSPTGADAAEAGFTLGDSFSGLAYAEVHPVSGGGPLPIVSSDSNKLTPRQKSELKKYPILARHLFPGTVGGNVQADHKRVHFQAGQKLRIAGNVDAGVRSRAVVVVEKAPILGDGSLGHWYPVARITPGGNGSFSHEHEVEYGMQSLRARLEVGGTMAPAGLRTAAAAPAAGAAPFASTPVALSYNAFGITTAPWQVANHQGFDRNGNYFNSDYTGPATAHPIPGPPITWAGIEFQTGPIPTSNSQVGGSNGPQNFVQARGQSIAVDVEAGKSDFLYLAGAASNGNQKSQKITLKFTDNSEETWTQSFTDWSNNGSPRAPRPYKGEFVLKTQPERINQMGDLEDTPAYIFGYGYDLKGKQLAGITLPNNENIGILSAVVSQAPVIAIDQGIESFVLGQVNLTGVDMMTLTIRNESNIGAGGGPLTFFFADQPVAGSVPTASAPATYTTKQFTVPMGQQQTIIYIAPGNSSQMNFYVQKGDDTCVGPNCSTYLTDWNNGSGHSGNWASNISPSLNSQMESGQHWTMTVQNAGEGYYGYLDSPSGKNLPGASGNTPAGAQFKLMTQAEINSQPAWATALEKDIGKIVGLVVLSVATGGLADELGAAGEALEVAGGAGEDAFDDTVSLTARIGDDIPEDFDADLDLQGVETNFFSDAEISAEEDSILTNLEDDDLSRISRDSINNLEETALDRALNEESYMRMLLRR